MRWSEKETYKFVKLYLSYDYLWNPEDANYKTKNKRQQAYLDIIYEFQAATGMRLTETEVKMKIKNLRSTYTQELVKIRERSGPNFVYTPKIKWFPEWHRRFSARDNSTHYETHEDDSSQKIWLSTDDNDEGQADPFVSNPEEDYMLILKSEPSDTSEDKIESYKMKRKRIRKRSSVINNTQQSYQSIDSHIRDDEFDIYGKYIASQLRKLDVQKALRVQLEIQSIVSDARLSSMCENSNNYD